MAATSWPRDGVAYCALSPRMALITATIARTPDEAWRRLRAAVTEPDALHDGGWRVARVRVVFEAVDGEEEAAW